MVTQEQKANARILIVDDKAANVLLLEQMLKQNGFQSVRSITDPRQTISIYREFNPDLVLLDLNMPHLNGFEVMDRLNEIEEETYAPILVLTAQGDRDTRLRALESGAKDFLSKPFDIVEVVRRISNMLEIRLLHNQILDQNKILEEKVKERTFQLERTRREVIERLGKAAEYRDNETGMHVIRMSRFSARLGKAYGMGDQEVDLLLNASPMHDVGKIGIPDNILLKPGKLDHDEWQSMKTHAQLGAEILSGSDSEVLQLAEVIAVTHHEKWDGSGYPNGLKEDAIPVAGQIIALADVFDALTTEHPYKKAWSVLDAMKFIEKNSGSHFNPQLVDLWKEILPDILEIKENYAEHSENSGQTMKENALS